MIAAQPMLPGSIAAAAEAATAAAAAAALTSTIQVGKYKLYETIGQGAFGKVKIGVNEETGVHVAVKMMDKREIREQDLSAQVRREIYVMKLVSHRHIVRLIEVMTSKTKVYMVMELVTGGELFDRLDRHGRVDEATARRYFQQLVDGVDFCHQVGVAHRDLKPENLLLDENDEIKVSDFGFAAMKKHNINTQLLTTQCGTPDYCAPEIIEGAVEEGYNGAKVDVWSCGVILYALLVGNLPFVEEDIDRLYDLILGCKVHYPSFLPPGAVALLRTILVLDPAVRASLDEVKRNPWFLADYVGDDARALRKPAFYKKGNSPAPPFSRSSSQRTDGSGSGSATDGGASSVPQSIAGEVSSGQRDTAPSHESPSQRDRPVMPRASSGSRISAMGRGRVRRDGAVDPTATPPADSILTMVHDRPGTPGQRRAVVVPRSGRPNAATMAEKAELGNGRPSSSVDWAMDAVLTSRENPSVNGMEASLVGLPSFLEEQTNHAPPFSALDNGAEGDHFPAIAERMAEMLTDEADLTGDAYLSDNDSVEDYENRPVPTLSLPVRERFARHQTAQGIGHQQRQMHQRQKPIGVPMAARHRSDSHVMAGADGRPLLPLSVPFEQQQPLQYSQQSVPAQLHRSSSPAAGGSRTTSPRRARQRGSGREAGNIQSERESRSTFLAGRTVRYKDNDRRSAPVSPMDKQGSFRSIGHGATSGSNVPWHDNNSEDDVGLSPSDIPYRMWDLVERWRFTMFDEREGPSTHMPELRMVHRSLQNEITAISDVNDKLAVYEQFMAIFGRDGLGDVATKQYGDGSEHDSASLLRGLPSEMSSEDDGGWSPTLHDSGRRREVSDLLPKWMRRHSATGRGGRSRSRPNSTGSRPGSADVIESDDGGISMDVPELQRMLKHSEHDQDSPAFVEEIDRLMKSSPASTLLTGDGTGDESGQDDSGTGADTARFGKAIPHVDGIGSTVCRTSHRVQLGADSEAGSGVFGVSGRPPSPGASLDAFAPPQSPGRRNGRKVEMAASMGLGDVEYYGSDRRGVSKLKGVFTQIKRGKRLPETETSFQSSREPDDILFILSHILHGLGGEVQLKKETKRKLQCALPFPSGLLHVAIELSVGDNGVTSVSFKRSRQDRGKTDKTAFINFFHLVHNHYVAEVQARGPGAQQLAKRRSQPAGHHSPVDMLQNSFAGDLELPGRGGIPDSFSSGVPVAVRRGEGSIRPLRAASDMR